MARKKRESGGGTDDWLNTYADMVTLLLTFFVMLFSMSSVDAEKWEALVKAFSNPGEETAQVVLIPEGDGDQQGTNKGEEAPTGSDSGDNFGAPPTESKSDMPQDLDQLYEYLKEYIESNQMQGSVSVEKSDENVFIRFSDNIFFNPDSANLRAEAIPILDFLGEALYGVTDEILAININGYTAELLEMTNYPVNDRVLSAGRAASVAVYLEEKKQIDPELMVASGFGRLFPVGDNKTAEGRSKNRRVDILIVSNKNEGAGQKALVEMLQGGYDPLKKDLPPPPEHPNPTLPEDNEQASGSNSSGASPSASPQSQSATSSNS